MIGNAKDFAQMVALVTIEEKWWPWSVRPNFLLWEWMHGSVSSKYPSKLSCPCRSQTISSLSFVRNCKSNGWTLEGFRQALRTAIYIPIPSRPIRNFYYSMNQTCNVCTVNIVKSSVNFLFCVLSLYSWNGMHGKYEDHRFINSCLIYTEVTSATTPVIRVRS